VSVPACMGVHEPEIFADLMLFRRQGRNLSRGVRAVFPYGGSLFCG